MTLYENNINIIKEKYNNIYNLLESIELKEDVSEEILNIYSQLKYKDVGETFKIQPLQLKSIFVCNGTDSLFGFIKMLQELESNKVKNSYVYLLERDIKAFKIGLHLFDISNMLNYDNFNMLIGNYTTKDIENMLHTRIHLAAGSIQFYHFNKDKTCETIIRNEIFRKLAYYGNSMHDSYIGQSQMLQNLNNILSCNPAIDYKDLFKNKPCLLLASGKSLDEYLPIIKEWQDKAVLISTDSLLRDLLNYGIRPHFVAAIERVGISPLFEDLPEHKDITLVSCPVLEPKIYDMWQGNKIMIYRSLSHFLLLESIDGVKESTREIGGSCSNLAFTFALEYLGCNPIILCGQDLGIIEKGDGSHSVLAKKAEKIQESEIFEYFPVPANNGKTIQTRKDWFQFLWSYNVDVERANKIGVNIFNTSLDGALIQGCIVKPLDSVLSKIKPIEEDIRQSIFNVPLKYNKDEYINKSKEISLYCRKFLFKFKEDTLNILKMIKNVERKLMAMNNEKDKLKEVDKLFYYITKFENIFMSYTDTKNENQTMFFRLLMHISQSIAIGHIVKSANMDNVITENLNVLYRIIGIKKRLFESYICLYDILLEDFKKYVE